MGIVGLIAQLVDGSLGMAYGVTSTTPLLAIASLTPALASTAVHLSEVGTTLASGVSHWLLAVWATALYFAISALRRERQPVLEA